MEDSSSTLEAGNTSTADAELHYRLSADLVTLTDSRPAEAEAIRTVRTHIMAQHLADGRRGIAICAPTPAVGCTFVAVNLAVALSQVGIATLLIDADLRSPQVQTFVDPGGTTEGLKQFLATADARPGDFIHDGVLPNLSIMYSGGVADDAQELLANDSFRGLIDRCLRDFEFTIIDTPAANLVADALRISSMIGYTLIVAKAHSTRFSDVTLLAKQLHEDGADVVGTVLNET